VSAAIKPNGEMPTRVVEFYKWVDLSEKWRQQQQQQHHFTHSPPCSIADSRGIPGPGWLAGWQNANHLPPKTPPGFAPSPSCGFWVVGGLSNSVVSAAMGRMIY